MLPHLNLLEEVRHQPLDVRAHVLLQHLGQVGEERVAVLVKLGAVELQPLLRLPATMHDNTHSNSDNNNNSNSNSNRRSIVKPNSTIVLTLTLHCLQGNLFPVAVGAVLSLSGLQKPV